MSNNFSIGANLNESSVRPPLTPMFRSRDMENLQDYGRVCIHFVGICHFSEINSVKIV